MHLLELLRAERDKVAQQVNALDTAIRALGGLNSTGATRGLHGPRTMSAAARARISASQKARWARTRGQKVVSVAPKRRRISAAGWPGSGPLKGRGGRRSDGRNKRGQKGNRNEAR